MSDNALAVVVMIATLIGLCIMIEADSGAVSDGISKIVRAFRGKK